MAALLKSLSTSPSPSAGQRKLGFGGTPKHPSTATALTLSPPSSHSRNASSGNAGTPTSTSEPRAASASASSPMSTRALHSKSVELEEPPRKAFQTHSASTDSPHAAAPAPAPSPSSKRSDSSSTNTTPQHTYSSLTLKTATSPTSTVTSLQSPNTPRSTTSSPSTNLSGLELLGSSSSRLRSLDASDPESMPEFASELAKRGATFRSWSTRWYVFRPSQHRIVYYKDEKTTTMKGEIPLIHFSVTPNPDSPELEFIIVCPGRDHILRAESSDLQQRWIAALSEFKQRLTQKQARLDAEVGGNDISQALETNRNAKDCAGCKTSFSVFVRRHPCAGCGQMFCGQTKCMVTTTDKKRFCIVCHDKKAATTCDTNVQNSNSNILIRILEGKDLMACDSNGLSDPYCVIYFEEQEYKTEVKPKTLNPVFNQEFTIPVGGTGKAIQIAMFDKDLYSKDDFMGMVHIPIHDLENDALYDDWFPLKRRPGMKADASEPISGSLHLQVVMSTSVVSFFSPVWQDRIAPADAFNTKILQDNFKRLAEVFKALELDWYQTQLNNITTYTSPTLSIIALLLYIYFVLYFPAEWVLPAIPALLLFKMIANLLGVTVEKDIAAKIEEEKMRLAIEREKAQLAASQSRFPLPVLPPGGLIARAFTRKQVDSKDDKGKRTSDSSKDQMTPKGRSSPSPKLTFKNGMEGPNADTQVFAEGVLGEDAVPDEDDEDDVEGDELADEVEEKQSGNIFSKMKKFKKQLATFQNAVGQVCDLLEGIQSLVTWKDTRKSKILAQVLLVATIALWLIPVRILLLLAGVAKWSKYLMKIIKKKSRTKAPRSEVLNLLDRSPTSVGLRATKRWLPAHLKK